MLNQIRSEVFALGNPEKVERYKKFFQCHPGGYGEGDQFIGVSNPPLRALSKQYQNISLADSIELLKDPYHEIRLLALFILVLKYSSKKASKQDKENVFQAYLKHTPYINNWDLVDSAAYQIVGAHAFAQGSHILDKLVNSSIMWENRIAMVATWFHIRKNSFQVPLAVATKLAHHEHDLIHKAVGWMLREIGKRDLCEELKFLEEYQLSLPRTALRYSIEKFDEPLRKSIMQGEFNLQNHAPCI